MKNILLFSLLMITAPCLAQSQRPGEDRIKPSGAQKLIFMDSVSQAIRLAKYDIARGTPFLLLQSGISPVVYAADHTFENRYKVSYLESGCTGSREKLASAYDRIIFAYLDVKYGQKWRKEIRPDVIGLKKWKPK